MQSSFVLIAKPHKTSASAKFGVITVANGNNFSIKVFAASSSIKRLPAVETITGSETIFLALYSTNLCAIISMISLFATIPILTASG